MYDNANADEKRREQIQSMCERDRERTGARKGSSKGLGTKKVFRNMFIKHSCFAFI